MIAELALARRVLALPLDPDSRLVLLQVVLDGHGGGAAMPSGYLAGLDVRIGEDRTRTAVARLRRRGILSGAGDAVAVPEPVAGLREWSAEELRQAVVAWCRAGGMAGFTLSASAFRNAWGRLLGAVPEAARSAWGAVPAAGAEQNAVARAYLRDAVQAALRKRSDPIAAANQRGLPAWLAGRDLRLILELEASA